MFLMKKCIYLVCLISVSCFSQELSQNFIKEIQENLIAYRIKYHLDDIYCLSDFKNQIGTVFLSNDEEYAFDYYYTSELNYPISDFKLYVIFNNFYLKKKVNLSKESELQFIHGMGYSTKISSKLLIGISSKNKIYYISGSIFKNCIADDFSLNKKNSASFNVFLTKIIVRSIMYCVVISSNLYLTKKALKNYIFKGF